MDSPLKIQIILGSTRPERFGDKPAHYLRDELNQKPGVEAELIDLRDWPLPFYDEPIAPARNQGNYANPLGKQWAGKVAEADGYIMISPEYNHGYSAVLKNALDWVGPEWKDKPVGFVGYGNAGGARAIEQLRQVVVELSMHPLKSAIHIPTDIFFALRTQQAPADPALFKGLRETFGGDRVEQMFDELFKYARLLRTVRA